MFHVKHWWARLLGRMGRDVPRETSRPTYKELMMRRDAFKEIRQRIDLALSCDQIHPMEVDFDDATEDVLVSGTFGGVQRTYRLTITEESSNVPRETSEGP